MVQHIWFVLSNFFKSYSNNYIITINKSRITRCRANFSDGYLVEISQLNLNHGKNEICQ